MVRAEMTGTNKWCLHNVGMNILIRKNFNADSGGRDRSHGKLGHRHRKSHGGVHGNRGRESVFCNVEEHCCSTYRTHLFLNTANSVPEYEEDTASTTTQTKTSSFPLLRWAVGSIKRKSSVNKCDYLINQLGDPISSSRKVRVQLVFVSKGTLYSSFNLKFS